MPAPLSVQETSARARFGARVRELRGAAPAEALAERLGIHLETLRRVERGQADLPLRLAPALALALGVSVTDLLPPEDLKRLGALDVEPIAGAGIDLYSARSGDGG